ncbi:hypothetical protein [Paraliomyxa miuraensis]|uniref:hypothetical protein n=1 Tax=Paraliomyxa miuraensis TaxID=376150 RepID=UPI0022552F29|nr:hypothetical protein [Paraliomyxa miuraensis]MCX4239684.1 hypothetical protein [Paraliomyxa miuraensis]
MTLALRHGEPLCATDVRTLLDTVARRPPAAAWHPTGFVVVPLHHDDHGALRLHLWPPDQREHGSPCWPIHDHVWHLRSHVLCGTVESHGYEVDDDAEGEAVLYAVEYGPGHRSCLRRSERRVRVRAMAPRRVAAGESYEVDAGAFHASQVPASSMAATLVLTRRTDQPWPWVVGEPDAPARVPVERPLADGAMVRAVLQRVSAALPR